MPALVRGVPLQDYGWSVVEKWTPEYLEAQIEDISSVHTSSETRFVHYTDTFSINTLQNTAEILGDTNWKPTYQLQHLASKDFFRQLQDPKVYGHHQLHRFHLTFPFIFQSDRLYCRGDIHAWKNVAADMGDTSVFFGDSKPQVVAWIGSERITTAMHYEASENMFLQVKMLWNIPFERIFKRHFAQVHGHSRFLLMSPKYSDACYLYSSKHPVSTLLISFDLKLIYVSVPIPECK